MSDWKFDVDEVGDDAEADPRPDIEPGSPSLENVLFVLLGVLTTLFAFASVAGLFGP